jgi:hypothetical protein
LFWGFAPRAFRRSDGTFERATGVFGVATGVFGGATGCDCGGASCDCELRAETRAEIEDWDARAETKKQVGLQMLDTGYRICVRWVIIAPETR